MANKMNKQRREDLYDVVELLDKAAERLTEIRDEEEAYENLPDSLQDSERGNAMQDAICQLEDWEGQIGAVRCEIEKYTQPPSKKKSIKSAKILKKS